MLKKPLVLSMTTWQNQNSKPTTYQTQRRLRQPQPRHLGPPLSALRQQHQLPLEFQQPLLKLRERNQLLRSMMAKMVMPLETTMSPSNLVIFTVTFLNLNHATFCISVLVNHGVSKSNIGFILDATYTWIISLILLICMCYRPQRGEPRSRQEAPDELFGTRATEESRIFKATFTVLLFFFNLLHWGMFMSFSQTLPQLQILASTSSSSFLERVFVGVFTATRFLAILTGGVMNPAVGIFISLFIILVGSLILVFTQQISAAAVWAGVILQAVSRIKCW